MAIAFDSSGNLGNNGGTGSLTAAFNNAAGDIAFVGLWRNGNDDLTAVTYDSVSMSLVDKETANPGGFFCYLYMLVAPSTGSHNVVVTASTNSYILGVATSYNGSSATGQPDAFTNHLDFATTNTISVTTVADNCWGVCVLAQSFGATPVSGTNATLRVSDTFAQVSLYDTNSPKTPPGSLTMVPDSGWGTPTFTSAVMASFKPSTGFAGNPWYYYAQQQGYSRHRERMPRWLRSAGGILMPEPAFGKAA